MRERPILFSAPMVRAILEGRKTQTRRAVKPVGNDGGFVILNHGTHDWPYRSDDGDSTMHTVMRGGKLYLDETPHACPYGQPGDRLWVRETWQAACGDKRAARIVEFQSHDFGWVEYAATCDDPPPRWRPSIHMPRWASRILLEITAVRVERLQDISPKDAVAEGCTHNHHKPPGTWNNIIQYQMLWESINGPGSWDANPWVWVIEFRRIV